MRRRPDHIPMMRRGQTSLRWGIYSVTKAEWIGGDYASRTAAEEAARMLDRDTEGDVPDRRCDRQEMPLRCAARD